MIIKRQIAPFLILLLSVASAFSQQKNAEKYPSLLWEITGNGLTKPSYLFGTMHVSNKLAFHLSDSFYTAIRRTDAVALELNPDVWQGEMVRIDKLKDNYSNFIQQAGNDYLTENSFRIKNYAAELKTALQTEPALVNSLLYRSYKVKEDFEEDTFLDLYIFQTGRKLGKAAAGVEDYYQTEKLVLEAYADMAKEKKKKNSDIDADLINNYTERVQDAYRKGDLDLLDSLDNLTEQSVAFREKFLYKRNEIQANAIDSIIRKASLFAGVGASHLPGSRGVIELLRRKGYTLRPIIMSERSGLQKNEIDQLHVPVVFKKKIADDDFYSVDVPGDLYKAKQDYQNLDRVQYADMSNGSYYLITRVKTYAAFIGQSEQDVMKKIDSVLYENIPGKILSKQVITRNGYNGYDISSKTRRGDQQRYQIFVTAFEIIIFKMSGKDNYVSGDEANRFFSSITLKEKNGSALDFRPAQGGFSMKLPQAPVEYLNNTTADDRWEYMSSDKSTGDAYLVFRKSIYNFNYLDEDSFDVKLIEESFRSSEYFDKQLSRKQSSFNGYPSLEVKEQLKDGSIVNARYFIIGPHYYVIAQRKNPAGKETNDYLSSFSSRAYNYPASKQYIDTFLHVSVSTPVAPEIDGGMRSVIEQSIEAAANGNNYNGYISYWQKPRNGIFKSDSTGETIALRVQEFPKYFYIRDSLKYWQTEVTALLNRSDMYLYGKVENVSGNNFSGVSFTLRDTGSSRTINHLLLIRNGFGYKVTSMGDTINGTSPLAREFLGSFRPLPDMETRNLYQDKLDIFFSDLFSTDSALHKKAQRAIANVQYGIPGIPKIMDAINRLSVSDKDYFDSKSRLIAELGYIKDSTSDILVRHLGTIYEKTADTSLFQNEVIKALARLKTKASFRQLKEYLLNDPPVFENSYDYNSIFSNLDDTLQLCAGLFPGLLQLSSLDDYKEKVKDLLIELVDSGYARQGLYDKYFPSIYIDAVTALKKQKSKDEKQMKDATKAQDDDEAVRVYTPYNRDDNNINNYSLLLIPYYGKDKNVRNFFDKLLQSKDEDVRLNTAVLMLRYNREVPDSIILDLAANEKYSSTLLSRLARYQREDKFPAAYKTQMKITRSSLLKVNRFSKLDSMVYLSRLPASIKGKTGMLYFFKYRVKSTDQWRIAYSGLQPADVNEVSTDFSVVNMTEVRLKESEPVDEQLNTQLKKITFRLHRSGRNFYVSNNNYVRPVDEFNE